VKLPLSDKVVVGDLSISSCLTEKRRLAYHDRQQWGEDDNVSRQESSQALSRLLDLPRTSNPSTEERSDECSSLDVEPSGEKEGEIVRRGDTVGGDVGTEGG
jgi:hypothetical protein